MTILTKIFFVALFCGGLLLCVPESASTQGPGPARCALCEDNDTCKRSQWGTGGCTFKSGRCELTGRACNPAMALNLVSPDDRRIVPSNEESRVVVRLEGDAFGAWDCRGELVEAYRELANGRMVELAAGELAMYGSRYRFHDYIRRLAEGTTGK